MTYNEPPYLFPGIGIRPRAIRGGVNFIFSFASIAVGLLFATVVTTLYLWPLVSDILQTWSWGTWVVTNYSRALWWILWGWMFVGGLQKLPAASNGGPTLLFMNFVWYLAPGGVSWWFPRPFGWIPLANRVHVEARNVPGAISVGKAESADRVAVGSEFNLNRYFVRWPWAYFLISGSPGEALKSVLKTRLREFIRLYSHDQIFTTLEDATVVAARVLTGELDEVFIPEQEGIGDEQFYELSRGLEAQHLASKLYNIGVFIPPDGVALEDFTPPEDVLKARSETLQTEARNEALELTAALEHQLLQLFPGVDIQHLRRMIYADGDVGNAVFVDSSGGGGQLLDAAAVLAALGRLN